MHGNTTEPYFGMITPTDCMNKLSRLPVLSVLTGGAPIEYHGLLSIARVQRIQY